MLLRFALGIFFLDVMLTNITFFWIWIKGKAQGSDAFRHLKLLTENDEPITDKQRISFPEVDPLGWSLTFPAPKVI